MRSFVMPLAIVMSLVLSPALAADDEHTREMAACAANTNEGKRLDCYDGLAKRWGVPAATADGVQEETGKWNTLVETSKLDDSTNVLLILTAEDGIETPFGFRKSFPSIQIQCREGSSMVFIDWKVFLGTGPVEFTYRLDKEKAVTERWNTSTDHQAVGVTSLAAIRFARSMFGNKQLFAKITPYGENPVTATFDIRGIQQATKPLGEACNW